MKMISLQKKNASQVTIARSDQSHLYASRNSPDNAVFPLASSEPSYATQRDAF